MPGGLPIALPAAVHPISGDKSRVTTPYQQFFASLLTGPVSRGAAPEKTMQPGEPIDFSNTYICLVDGTSASPNTRTTYETPCIYVERHTDNPSTATYCDWGNVRLQPAIVVETVAYGNEVGNPTGISCRTFTATTAPANAQPLTAFAGLAQSNAPGGTANRDIYAANLIATFSSGNKPSAMVGLEVDIIPSISAASTIAGAVGADNFIGLLMQAAGGTFASNTGLFISATTVGTGGGWQYGVVVNCDVYQWCGWFRSTVNDVNARGVYIETAFTGATGRVLSAFAAAGVNEQFRVDADATNPVWVRVGGTIENVTAGAPNSGGAGFRQLLVPN